MCEFFVEICVKMGIFVQKTWKSRTMFYQKSLEIQPPLWGEGKNFLEQPNIGYTHVS